MSDTNTNTVTKPKLQRPAMYTVLFLNDDFSPMDFVVEVLVKIFNQGIDDATMLMMKIHKEGKANVGNYTFDVANHKCNIVTALARQNEFPLLVSPEPI